MSIENNRKSNQSKTLKNKENLNRNYGLKLTYKYKKVFPKILQKKKYFLYLFFIVVGIIAINDKETVTTSSIPLSAKKIEWGIKRNDNHVQSDLGNVNKELIDKYNGIAIGNNQ